MIVSNIYLNYLDAFAYDGKPPRPDVDPRQFGTGATDRLYECASTNGVGTRARYENPDPRWVMLAARDDGAFTRLCRAAGRDDLAADRRFATVEARAEHRVELEELLASLFATRTAPDWESALCAAGVGCVVADDMSHFAFLYRDQQARAIAMMTTVAHPSIGTYWRYAPVLTLSDTPSRAPSFCELGEHTTRDPHGDGIRRRRDRTSARRRGRRLARRERRGQQE